MSCAIAHTSVMINQKNSFLAESISTVIMQSTTEKNNAPIDLYKLEKKNLTDPIPHKEKFAETSADPH